MLLAVFGIGLMELLILVGMCAVPAGIAGVIVILALVTARKNRPPPNLVPCPACGELMPPTAATCPQCGRPLSAA
jgi:hypothetical protein